MIRLPLFMLLGCVCLAAIGCVQPSQGTGEPAIPDPFGVPGGYCDPGCCPPGFDCSPNQCPPGGCPPRTSHEVGVEVGASGNPYPVNSLAQNELKGGFCIPCQPAAMQPTVIHRQPAAPPQQHVKPSPADEVKQGRFQCERCKRPTVGKDWQEIWSDDGLSILCMCKECYRTATPLQREVTMRNYLSRHGVDTKTRPLVEAAVVEASRGY